MNRKRFTYIIKSGEDGKNYIGSTADMQKKLAWHNAGKNAPTRYCAPFTIIYIREFEYKSAALAYERWLKKQKGGFKVKQLIAGWIKARNSPSGAPIAQW